MDSSNPEPTEGAGMGAGARVLREIIRTPAFMEIIKTNMASIDPEFARAAVRTLLWQDVNLSLGMLGQSPVVVNYLVEALLELGRQLNQFPSSLLEQFLLQLGDEIDSGALSDLPAVYGEVLGNVISSSPDVRDRIAGGLVSSINVALRAANAVMELMEGDGGVSPPAAASSIDAAELGRAVTLSARLVNRQASRNPYFLRDVFRSVEWREVLLAALAVGRSLVLCVVDGLSRLVSRMKR